MVNVIISWENGQKQCEVEKGSNLLKVIRDNSISLDTPCNGNGTCGKCKVKINSKNLRKDLQGIEHLRKEEIELGIRLACNTTIEEDMEVFVTNENKGMSVLVSGIEKNLKVDSLVKKKHIILTKPSLEDQRDDFLRVKESCSDICNIDDIAIDIKLLTILGEKIREYDFDFTVTFFKNKIVHIEKGNTVKHNYGIAVDIGTTTIAAYLINLNSGEEIDVLSQVNNQRSYGADVISRINYTMEESKGLEKLQQSIVNQLCEMINILCEKNSICKDNIYDTVIVGNTTMIQILLGIPCKNIAMAPYIPTITDAIEFNAREIGIDLNSNISLMPGVAAYVGSDISAGILSSGMIDSQKYSLLLDLGTNGEMALGNKDEVITCSTAAGPAFEGANIKYGIGGIKGAISKIDLSTEPIFETIGYAKPCGICGSGVLDAVSEMIKYGIVDETGRMVDEDDDDIECREFLDRIVEIDHMKQFIITKDKDIISFTQKDVREVQLAKAAINAGIQIILKERNLDFEDIENLYIAGGFGNYMNTDSALQIGMIPFELKGKIKSIGNSAGSGAKMYLKYKECRKIIKDMISKSDYVELSSRIDFQEYFVDGMMMERIY